MNRHLKTILHAALALVNCVLVTGAQAESAEPLRPYAANVSAVSVSGISAGGYMAVQFHVAHSAIVHGAGVLAAGPYYCAQGSSWAAQSNCMKPDLWAPVTATPLIKTETDTLAELNAIDDTANLRRARVWLFSGTRDETVLPIVVEALAHFYRLYVPAASVKLVHDIPAGHAMVTVDYGSSCSVTAAPYINNCHYDAAGELLEYIEGSLSPPAGQESGRLVAFDQSEFADGQPGGISLADTGYHTRTGPQIRAVKAMLDRLGQKRS